MNKPVLSVKEQAELNKSWDEYANMVRSHIQNGTMPKPEAAKLGMMIDQSAEGAKTAYISKSMFELAGELVDFLTADGHEDAPDFIKPLLDASAKRAKDSYAEAIASLEAEVKAELDAISAESKAEVASPAKGIFADATLSAILNAKSAEGLPNN